MKVLKFGGTSLGTCERLSGVSDIIKETLTTSDAIVVVSATSNSTKSLGTTSQLLEAAKHVLVPHSQKYLEIMDSLRDFHLELVYGLISNHDLKRTVSSQIQIEIEKLRSFLAAAEIIDEISARSRDIIISTGEKLSARILTALLLDRGINAKYVCLDNLVKDKSWSTKPLDQKFYDYLIHELSQLFSSNVYVPVVTGYLGILIKLIKGPVPGSLLKTIGRGYTDLTAALISVATTASELQIWKEVDGVFSADPRKVNSARLLSHLSPEETAELTYYGSEVIHPFTMDQVIRASIPIRIKNTFNPSGHGSVIIPSGYVSPMGSFITFEDPKALESKHPIAATLKEGVIVLNIISNRKSVSHGFFEKLFSILDAHGIVVDLISTTQVQISMAISNNDMAVGPLEPVIRELSIHGDVDVSRDLAILSLVGKDMKRSVGVASKMFNILAKNSVNIHMISQGASEINISCVIDQSQGDLALRVVHDCCVLNSSE